MTDPHPRIGALEVWLGRAVGDVMAAAIAIPEPAGMSQPWLALLENWGVKAMSPDARVRAARAAGLTYGAPMDELFDLLTVITKTAEDHLKLVDWPDDGPGERRWERLRSRIFDTRDKALVWYRKQVVPARAGGMFGNAIAAAQKDGGTVAAPKSRPFMLRCHNCGAPRMDAANLDCDFCGHHFGHDKYGNKHGA